MKLKLQENKLYFWPVSGAGQIGRNFNLYGFDGEWIIVDWGVSFNQGQGVDVVFPDHTVLNGLRKNLKACLLTHAHEDHIGALQYFWDKVRCPIFATPFTAAMVEYQFKALGIDYTDKDINVVKMQKDVQVSENFTARFVPLNHSIPDAAGIYLRTPEVKVFHTGDWRIDPDPILGKSTSASDFSKIKSEGVDLLVCDSTNVNSPEHQGSETEVAENMMQVFAEHKKQRIFVTCFASNIERMISIAAAAKKHRRKVCLLGRSFGRTHSIAEELKYLKNFPDVVSPQEAVELPDNKVAFICSGSQGEARASLSTMAAGRHRFVNLKEGDLVVFSSRNIPGNERRIALLKNALELAGARILSGENLLLHVSGHPSQAELLKMYEWVKPKMLLPVHGEFYHLAAHKEFGLKKRLISEFTHNGHLYECSADSIKNVMRADVQVFGLDGKRIVPMSSRIFSARDRLGSNGIITISVAGGQLAQMMHYGLWEDETLDGELRSCVERCVRSNAASAHAEMIASLKGEVVHWVRTNTGKNPVVIVLASEAGRGRRDKRSSGRSPQKRKNASQHPNSNPNVSIDAPKDDVGNLKEPGNKRGGGGNQKRTRNNNNNRDGATKEPYADVIAKYMDD